MSTLISFSGCERRRSHEDEGEEPADERHLRTVPQTVLQEFYQVAFRKRLYTSLEQLQADLDVWLVTYNEQRTHQGKMCCGRTPWETFEDGRRLAQEKVIDSAA